MVECNPFQIRQFEADRAYYNQLDIENFSLMLKDPTFCYKFYWLEAIVMLIDEDVEQTTFDTVINEMIANAWYTVLEYHIHLSGMRLGHIDDSLEKAVLLLSQLSQLPSNASKEEIRNAIKIHDEALKKFKEQLTKMVPYRALAGFFKTHGKEVNWNSSASIIKLMNEVNESNLLPYTFGLERNLSKKIFFSPIWIRFIQENSVSILGWVQYEKSKWLQTNNPEVPSIVNKLTPLNEKARKLANVRTLWNHILKSRPILDIYTHQEIQLNYYDVDHFVPWSFVMNDELWNLSPMDPSLNSSKSNRLPKWDFFKDFAQNQFILYQAIHEDCATWNLFEKCFRDNLHSIWAGQELFRPGNSKEDFMNILSKNMQPLYDSARRQGYEVWGY